MEALRHGVCVCVCVCVTQREREASGYSESDILSIALLD